MRLTKMAKRAEANPDHHLWNNHGTWFVHYTEYPTPITKQRVRKSLKTKCLEVARQRRDQLLGLQPAPEGGSGKRAQDQVATFSE